MTTILAAIFVFGDLRFGYYFDYSFVWRADFHS